ncbi:hypothetical protein K431DRAFT_289585 [Polychaeton citri CBS 116435]|uniref:Uncharacterized protein n=1 Tax=Polychaeton citri CBS 116435 TaxID=1314669 RepID=A0A9P4PY77_9PEZI|nr:hypothetical protein K431DRAFT_289585 [Polychaeton citri CBS 116435]
MDTKVQSQPLSPSDVQPAHLTSSQTSSLRVDFTWRKGAARISEPEQPDDAVYIADLRLIKAPHMVVKRVTDDRVIGSGSLSAVSINASYEIGDQKHKLQAAKRLKTEYTHLSHAYSSSESPVAMTWKSKANFKTWDFICVDEQQQPVARFTSNIWYVKKVGNIEFLGPKANDQAAREEILIVGLTLYNMMLLRINNPLNLLGMIPNPKPFNSNNASAAGDKDETVMRETTKGVERRYEGDLSAKQQIGREYA